MSHVFCIMDVGTVFVNYSCWSWKHYRKKYVSLVFIELLKAMKYCPFRLQATKKQSNQKPRDDGEQELPRSVSDISMWKEKLKKPHKRKKKRRKNADIQGLKKCVCNGN